MGGHLDLGCLRHQPTDPTGRRDQLGDRVLGRDRIPQDRGVQPRRPRPPAPGGLHDLADRLQDPPRPIRGPQTVAPGHQHRGMEALIVKAQPTGDLPGDVTPQRADRFSVRQALQRLQHHHGGDHLGRHRPVPATPAGQVGEQLGWEQLLTVVGQQGVHRPVSDQVAAPGRCVQLVIGAWRWGTCPGVCPAQSSSANYRIDTANEIGQTTPLQQAPRRRARRSSR